MTKESRLEDDAQQSNNEEPSEPNLIGSEIVVDYTEQFTPTIAFTTKEELISWVQEVGRRNGLVIVTRSSDAGGNGRRARINFACERFGHYKSVAQKDSASKKKRIDTGTKKCGCPFLLKGKNPRDDEWKLTVACGTHNHPAANYLEGHSYAGRLTKEEMKIMIQMSKSHAKPRDILLTLKERDVNNASTLKTIYNAKQKYKVLEYGGRSQMQQLMHKLAEEQYVEWHRCDEGTDVVKDLFWAHPVAIDLLRCFPHVLLMDCTYKTNKYRYPLLQIVGITSTEMTFLVAVAYLESEKEDNYMWALDKLKELLDGWSLPKVIVTDKELALMSAISNVFPDAINLLCTWHINKNVLAKSKDIFTKKDDVDAFMDLWNKLVAMETIDDYKHYKKVLFQEYSEYPSLLEYVHATWLKHHKKRFVKAWTNQLMHFGNTTINRVKSAHSKLKRYLGSSQSNFETSWVVIISMLQLEHTEIKASFEKSLNIIQHHFQDSIYKNLHGSISRVAMEKICEELKRTESIGIDREACGCVLRKTYGLPCAHELVPYKQANMTIPLSSVDDHWKKLQLISSSSNSQSDINCIVEMNRFLQKYESCDGPAKARMIQKLREISNPSSTSITVVGSVLCNQTDNIGFGLG